MATFKTDSSGQPYIEIETGADDECVRLTFIESAKYDKGRPVLRVQIRDAKGHLRQGPELPIRILDQIQDALGWARLLGRPD